MLLNPSDRIPHIIDYVNLEEIGRFRSYDILSPLPAGARAAGGRAGSGVPPPPAGMSEETRRRALAASVAPGADIDLTYAEAQALSGQDPLAAVKARWFTDDLHRAEYWADLAGRDVPWLVGEVERLRDLLARLEHIDFGRGMEGCPVCFRRTLNPHTKTCWLAEELAPERKEDAPP